MIKKNSFKDLPENIIILYIVSLISSETCIDVESCKESIQKLEELKQDLGNDSEFLDQIDKAIETVKRDLDYYEGLNVKKS